MPIDTNTKPRVLIGPLAERPVAPTEDGLIYVSEHSISAWNASLATWIDASSGSVGWPKYVVSTGDPLAPFSSIQAAINAAQLAGHSLGNPAVVLVMPGVYTEDVTLLDGIFVQGFVDRANIQGVPVGINGNVSVLSGLFFGLANVSIAKTLTVNNPAAQTLLSLSSVNVSDGIEIVACDPSSLIDLRSCLVNTATKSVAYNAIQPHVVNAVQSGFISGGTQSMILRGTALSSLSECNLQAQLQLIGAKVLLQRSNISVTGQSVINVDETSQLTGIEIQYLKGTSDLLFEGMGTVSLNGLYSLGAGASNYTISVDPNTQQNEPPYNPRGNTRSVVSANGVPLTLVPTDEIFIQANDDTVVTLVPAKTFIHGARVMIKTDAGSRIELHVAPGDQLDGVNNGSFVFWPSQTARYPYTSLVLQCDTSAPGWTVVADYTSVPDSPTYYVQATGTDLNPGSSDLPLEHVAEALRRLAITKWTGQATINVIGSTDEGADPTWAFPEPIPGGLPILVQGAIVDSGLGVVTPTGGVASSLSTPSLSTVTSAAPGGPNAYRGMFLRFTAGALGGQRFVINSNNGAGGFTLCGNVTPAPSNATPFVVEDLTCTINWSGNLRIIAPGGAWIDQLRFSSNAPSASVLVSNGILVTTACQIITGAANQSWSVLGNAYHYDGSIISVISPLISPPLDVPSAVILSGSRWDGSAGTLTMGDAANPNRGMQGVLSVAGSSFLSVDTLVFGQNVGTNASLFFGVLCAFSSCSWAFREASLVSFSSCILTTGRAPGVPGLSATINFENCAWNLRQVSITASPAATNIIGASAGSRGIIDGLSGANAGAGIPLVVTSASAARLLSQPTITGGVAGQEVEIGSNAPTTWLLAFGGLTANSTDLGNASSQMCRVGP